TLALAVRSQVQDRHARRGLRPGERDLSLGRRPQERVAGPAARFAVEALGLVRLRSGSAEQDHLSRRPALGHRRAGPEVVHDALARARAAEQRQYHRDTETQRNAQRTDYRDSLQDRSRLWALDSRLT